MKFRLILPLATAFMAAAAVPALAITVAGGIDPVSGMAALTPYVLRLAGAAICIICGVHGVMAVGEGRRFVPYLGAAVGGLALAFGAPYILTAYGVL